MRDNLKLLILPILLVLLFTACKYEGNTPELSSDHSKNPPLKTVYIRNSGNYIFNTQWPKEMQDSLLKIDSSFHSLDPTYSRYTFITTYDDSISINSHNINRNMAYVHFDGINGPTLKTYSINTNSNEFQNRISESNNKIKVRPYEKNINTPPTLSPHPYYKPNLLANKKTVTIQIPKKAIKIEAKKELDLKFHHSTIPLIKNLKIHFENDFWNYTDYYYTNGIKIDFTHPYLSKSPLSYLLISNATNGYDYYGFHMVQNMYTGSQPKVDTTIPGDRPWASYSYMGQNLSSFDHTNKLKHYSEINIGIMGPSSGGGFIQDLVHTVLPNNSSPEGWHNQINDDIIIDYQYHLQKLLFEVATFESYITTGVQIGTLRDQLNWGFGLKWGKFIPFYLDLSNLINRKLKNNDLFYSILGDIKTQFIGYDASLQGGVTDRTSVYVIPNRDMNRFVIQANVGFEITYGRYQLQFIQYWKSKEFKTGMEHKYVSTRLFIAF